MRIESIDRADDPRLDGYRDVQDPRWLRERGVFLAEGRKLVAALARARGFATRSVLATDVAIEALRHVLIELSDETPVYCVSRDVMQQVSGVRFHQGCVAAGEPRAAPSLDKLLGACGDRSRLVVLERVSDPDNVGSIFRSARAFGADGVLLSPGCASPLYRKAIRTSMGATLSLTFCAADPWPDALGALRRAGFALLALTPDGDVDVDALAEGGLPARAALIFGTEGDGISEEVRALADERVRIAIERESDSLNVANAAAIALHRLCPPTEG